MKNAIAATVALLFVASLIIIIIYDAILIKEQKALIEAKDEKIKIMDEQNYKLFRALDYCKGVNKSN